MRAARNRIRRTTRWQHWNKPSKDKVTGTASSSVPRTFNDLHERAGSRRMIHMHGQLFESRCEDDCGKPVFADQGEYESMAEIPRCECGARIRPHIVWFGEIPLEMDRIQRGIDRCTVLLVVGTSGVVYPAANFVRWANQRNRAGNRLVRTIYVGPEQPANADAFSRVVLGKAGEVLPGLFEVS